MPFEGERPNMHGHSGIVKNDSIKQHLRNLNIGPGNGAVKDIDCHDLDAFDQPDWLPDTAIAVDGSRIEPEVGYGDSTACIGFIDVSVVEVDLEELRDARGQPTVDPAIKQRVTSSDNIHLILPSENAYFYGHLPQPRCWRMMLYDGFKESTVSGMSLLKIYRLILEEQDKKLSDIDSEHVKSPLGKDGKIKLMNCPNPECVAQELRVPWTGTGDCPVCGIDTYPTDRLRLHERVNNHQRNLGALNETMEVIVHLAFAAAIHSVRNDPDRDISETAFIKDGPLAQFNDSKWIARPMLAFIERLRGEVDEMPPIVGLQKSGEFVAFADRLREEISTQTVVPLTTEDISSYVKENEINRTFGQREYYGKNFVYKSKSSYMFAITVPRRMETIRDVQSDPAAYPTLKRVLRTFDDTELALHDDSIIPIHLAHDEANIPEEFGSKVLRKFVKREAFDND